jgi:hypothetical protein
LGPPAELIRIRPHLLATRRRLGLGFDLIGLDDHEALVHRAGFVLGYRERRLTSGKARHYPHGLYLFPHGVGFLRVLEWQVVIDETRRVPEILGDGELVGCVPDGRRWVSIVPS